MSYCTKQDLINRYTLAELIQLTDAVGAGVENDNTINQAIADADGEIDAYISSRYSAPISPISKGLLKVACDITRYYLYDDQATDHVSDRYENSIEFLKGVAAGRISIGVDASGAKPESNNTAQVESGGNVFNRKDNSFI